MEESREMPSWLHNIVAKFKQSQLSLTVDDLRQIKLSESFKGLLMEIMQFAQKENSQPLRPQLLQELQKLGVTEIEEISTVVDVVLSSQKKSTIQYIQNQIVFPPPVVTAPKKTSAHTFGLPEEFVNFTGRKEPLEQLVQNLSRNQPGSQARVIISGTGGIGKTRLAVTAAYQQMKYHQESKGRTGCQSVIWFIAGTDDGVDNRGLMTEQFHRLGQELGLDPKQSTLTDLIGMVYKQLHEKHGPFLVVFDNAQNIRQISTFLPTNVPIIITTRNNNNRDFDPSFKSIALAVFTEAEALTYIQKFLAPNHPEIYQENEAKLLARILGYFPLALTQALAYIDAENITIQNYIEEFTQQKAQYLQERLPMGDHYQEEKNPSQEKYNKLPTEPYDPQKATVWTVIQLSLKKVTNSSANKIIKACSYLAPEASIHINLLCYWAANLPECRNAISDLRKYSLLENDPHPNHFRIHNLVQEILRLSDHEKDQIPFLSSLIDIMGMYFEKQEGAFIDESRLASCLYHLQAILAVIENVSAENDSLDKKKAFLYLTLGIINAELYADREKAFHYYQQALRIFESSPNQRNTAGTLTNFINDNNSQNNQQDFEALLERADPILDRIRNIEDTEKSETLGSLGSAIQKLSNSAGTKVLFERALNRDWYQVLEVWGKLGITLHTLADAVAAASLLERALILVESTFGPEDPRAVKILIKLGTANLQLDDPNKAITLFERGYTILERNSGPAHEVVQLLEVMAEALRKVDDTERAKGILEQLVEFEKEIAGPEHPSVAVARSNLGLCLELLGQTTEALQHYKHSYRVFFNHYGERHPLTLQSLKAIANIEIQQRREENEASDSDPFEGLGNSDDKIDQSTLHASETCDNKKIQKAKPVTKNARLTGFICQLLTYPSLVQENHLLTVAEDCFKAGIISASQTLLETMLENKLSANVVLLRSAMHLNLLQLHECRKKVLLLEKLDQRDNYASQLEAHISTQEQKITTLREELKTLQSKENLPFEEKIIMLEHLRALYQLQEALALINNIITNETADNLLAIAFLQQAECYFALERFEDAQRSSGLSAKYQELPELKELNQKITLALELAPKIEELILQLNQGAGNRPK